MKSNDVLHLLIKANDLLENAIKSDALNEFPYATTQHGYQICSNSKCKAFIVKWKMSFDFKSFHYSTVLISNIFI